jgi:hypothetical protein
MRKKYDNIRQYLNKGISTPAGILAVLSVVIVAGGLITWQVWPAGEVPSPSPIVSPTSTSTPTPTPTPDPIPTPDPYIKVISPNGGEEWEIGESYNIVWESAGLEEFADNLIVSLFNEGEGYTNLVSNISISTNEYSWIIGSEIEAGDSYKVMVTTPGASGISDASNICFSIVAKDETADWKTYTNEEYGFNFKYPDDKFTIKTTINNKCLESGDIREGPTGTIACDITFVPDFLGNLSIKEFVWNDRDFPQNKDIEDLIQLEFLFSEEIIGNEEWWRIYEPGMDEGGFNNYVNNEDTAVNFFNEHQSINDSEEFRKILSTFKFID